MNLQFKTSPVELKGSVAPWLATRKKSVTIRLARTVQVGGFDTRWDGGSRTEYSAYQIGRKESRAREGRDRGSISGLKTPRCGPVCKTVIAIGAGLLGAKLLKKR